MSGLLDSHDLDALVTHGLAVAISDAEILAVGHAWQAARLAVDFARNLAGTQAASLAERRAEEKIAVLRGIVQSMEADIG